MPEDPFLVECDRLSALVNPVQFDEVQVVPAGCPEHGQHTEELLLEAGVEWEQIEKYKESGAIL